MPASQNIQQKHQPSKYWSLWVCPTPSQKLALKSWPQDLQCKVLMLHGRTYSGVTQSIQTAIQSHYHESIVAPKSMFSKQDIEKIEKLAKAHGVSLTWRNTDFKKPFLAQLTLI